MNEVDGKMVDDAKNQAKEQWGKVLKDLLNLIGSVSLDWAMLASSALLAWCGTLIMGQDIPWLTVFGASVVLYYTMRVIKKGLGL